MKDIRVGSLVVVVPAAVALLSLIWYLRRKSSGGGKKNDRGSTKGKGSSDKSTQPAKDHDKPKMPVSAHPLLREDQGIKLNQRKIPETLDSKKDSSGHAPVSTTVNTHAQRVDITSTPGTVKVPALSASQRSKVEEIVQTAMQAGLQEANRPGSSETSSSQRGSSSSAVVDEIIVQESMVAVTSAPQMSQAPSQLVPKASANNSGNQNSCSEPSNQVESLSQSLSKTDTLNAGGDNQIGTSAGCQVNSHSSMDFACSTLMNSSSTMNTSWAEDDNDNSLACNSSDHALPIRSRHREPSTDSAIISPASSLRNSFSEEASRDHYNASDVLSADGCGPSVVEETEEKSIACPVAQSLPPSMDSCQQPGDPSINSASPGCDNNSVGSNDSGRGGSEQDPAIVQANENLIHFEFNMPSELCGRLIGRQGKNINQIKTRSGAMVSLTNNPFTPEFQICQVIGSQSEVDEALSLIRKKFPSHSNPRLTMAPLNLPAPSQQVEPQPVIVPEGVQLSLPEGVSVDVYVSAIVNAGHVFLQQPTHRTFMSLEKLNFFLNSVYGQDPTIPSVPEPVECGVICVCENEGAWYRTMITSPVEENGDCQVKFVDYGGYAQLPVASLKQIRTDFMSLPFQAVECFMANVSPMSGENFFSDLATLALSEKTQLKLLKCQVVARSEDGTPFVHLYDVDPESNTAIMLNRSMVEDNLVRWVEIL